MVGAADAERGSARRAASRGLERYEVAIIGAGLSGMYQLHRLRGLTRSVHLFEAGDGVGGTWYWNRYPGARFDSESWTYGFSFSDELLQEWNWSEHFSAQPETLRYCNYVADKFDLRRDITFASRLASADYDERIGISEKTTRFSGSGTPACPRRSTNVVYIGIPYAVGPMMIRSTSEGIPSPTAS